MRQELVRLFPKLRETKVSHSWMGFVGYTFDELAHTGQQDEVHYAMGYCGSGETSFPARTYYTGNPWFLAPAIYWYRFRDRINM